MRIFRWTCLVLVLITTMAAPIGSKAKEMVVYGNSHMTITFDEANFMDNGVKYTKLTLKRMENTYPRLYSAPVYLRFSQEQIIGRALVFERAVSPFIPQTVKDMKASTFKFNYEFRFYNNETTYKITSFAIYDQIGKELFASDMTMNEQVINDTMPIALLTSTEMMEFDLQYWKSR